MHPKEAPAPGAQTVRSPRHTVQHALRNTGVYCGGDFAVRRGNDFGMRCELIGTHRRFPHCHSFRTADDDPSGSARSAACSPEFRRTPRGRYSAQCAIPSAEIPTKPRQRSEFGRSSMKGYGFKMEQPYYNNTTPEQIAKALTGAKHILLLCHRRPDGDTVGSAFGLKFMLENCLPCRVEVRCADPMPKRLEFLSGGLPFDEAPDCEPELVAAIDVASLSMLGALREETEEKIGIKLDHHIMGDPLGSLRYTDADAAACGEIVYELCLLLEKETGTGMPQNTLDALYGAIVSDTGGFRYSNTTARTLRIAADLLERGADAGSVCHQLFESRSCGEVRAIRAAYALLHQQANGRIAVINLTNADRAENRLCEEDLGELASLPREIRGVEVGIFIRQNEQDPTHFKLSVRTGEGAAANEICAAFGGGGHIRAAGAELSAGSPEEAEEKVLEVVRRVSPALFGASE